MKRAGRVTPAEFEILELLWAAPRDMSVGQVLDRLRLQRPVAYTTVMTLLDKLHQKNAVVRKKKGKAFFYRPQVEKKSVLKRAVQEFSDDYFRGDASNLRAFLQRARRNGARVKPPNDTDRTEEAARLPVREEDVVLL